MPKSVLVSFDKTKARQVKELFPEIIALAGLDRQEVSLSADIGQITFVGDMANTKAAMVWSVLVGRSIVAELPQQSSD